MSVDLLRQAAAGDRVAQGALAAERIAAWREGWTSAAEGTAAAEVYARMAATSGDDVDLMGLASVLMLRASVAADAGEIDRSTTLQAEAISLLNVAADGGSEEAARLLSMAGDMCAAEAWTQARAARRRAPVR